MILLERFRQLSEVQKWALGVGATVVIIVMLAIVPHWALVIIPLVLWGMCTYLGLCCDNPPYDLSRFATALLIAWAADGILFVEVQAHAPHAYRHFVPAVIVVSIFAGFVVWRYLTEWAVKSPKDWSYGYAGSFLLAIFLMMYVVSPVLAHSFPKYWARVLAAPSQSDSDNDGDTP